ncbi:MAG: type IV secretion system DNA-binding domain-containing protein [Sphingomonas sp.]|nr:type IV secretion system DNA-binding domain-containing protein [Sphingomonas sp.]
MSIFRHDTLGSWTRGGQAIVHNVRMTTQVFYQTLLAGLVIWIGGIIWYGLEKSTDYERYVLLKLGQANFMGDAVPGNATPILFKTPVGREYWTTAKGLLDSGIAHTTLEAFERYLIHGAVLSGVFALAMLFWAWFYFTRTGRGLGSDQFLRGARFGTVRQVRRALWRHARGSFEIGGVNVPDVFEPEHILICGAPGTGKTNIIIKMLAGIRKRGKRAIVYDTAGTFVEKFYRPGIDVLLNPLDVRSDRWSPWVDVPKDYHYDQIAESTIPDKAGDPFWAKSARGTLVAVLRKLARQQRTLVSILLDTLLRSKLKDLAAFAQGTDAAAFISMEGERTSAGIQAELASVMRSFAFLDDTEDGLSIRDWVANERDDSWLFITVKADQLPSLRPLITVWLDIAISAIMSLTADRNRRLYCVIDELPSLQKLPSLSDFLARARKYGGCGILGFQSYPQLEATYGIQDAAAITGYCSTWVALRANDTPTAKHVSENLGQVEQVEANEGMSYGVNDMRDGVNLSRMQVTRPLVMHTEVTNLPNLCGYLRFGRNLPVVRFEDSYNRMPSIGTAFEERTTGPVRMALEPLAPPEPPAEPPSPPSRPATRRRRSVPADSGPELPLGQPAPSPAAEAAGPGRTADVAQPSPPPLTLYGKPTASRLRQHGRHDGDRNSATPA